MWHKPFVSKFQLLRRDLNGRGRSVQRQVFRYARILLCAQWYLAYDLSLRNLEEMIAERSIPVDHATVHRWVLRYSSELLERFNRPKRAVTGKWLIDETQIKVRGDWMCVDAPLNARKITTCDLGTAIGC
jgi:transposase-like protein